MSDQREQLLNLVYLRYEEAPEFLSVSGISTQMRIQLDASLGAELGDDGGDTTLLGSPAVGVGYSESPTITYIPQRDESFTRQLVAPVELDNIYLLTQYGWELERVLTLLVSRLNQQSFQSRQYRDLVLTLGSLQAQGLISVESVRRREAVSPPISAEGLGASSFINAIEKGYRFEHKSEGYILTENVLHYTLSLNPDAWKNGDLATLAANFKLKPNVASYELDPTPSENPNAIALTTRSVLGVMKYLSGAVSVPAAHADFVRNISSPPDQMLNVRVAERPVDDAFLSVHYRNHWYYVADDDVDSKKTLGLLTSLVRLNITTGGVQNLPVLTLPVGR
ncbi:MAG: hypothetical protein AAGF57_07290 [Pseudomonadota bacterium]